MVSGQNGLLILAGKSLRHDVFLVNLRCFPAFTIFFFPYNSAIQLKLVIQLTNLSLQSTFLFGCETGEVTGSPDGTLLLSLQWVWARREPSSALLGPIPGRYERELVQMVNDPS